MRECGKCKNHNFVVSDLVDENLSSDSSDNVSENLEVKFLWQDKNDGTVKVEVTLGVEDALIIQQETRITIKNTFLQIKEKMAVTEHLNMTLNIMRY